MAQLKKISDNIQKISLDNPATPDNHLHWLNINNAGKKEIEYLRKQYSFNLHHIQYALASHNSQRPIVEYSNNNCIFLILHFPVFKDNRLTSVEIDFFVGHGFLITVHNNVSILNDLFKTVKNDTINATSAYESGSSSILLYEILDKLISACFPILTQQDKKITDIEELIFADHGDKKTISHILALRRDLLNFRKIMQNHKNILKTLMEMKSSVIPQSDIRKSYALLVEHTKKIWEILENQKEMIEIFYDTKESLIGYKLSDIMKTLTIFSVIVFPLTLFAAIFSMDAHGGMPFLSSPHGFWIVIGIMGAICLGMLAFFARKKWL